MKKVLGVATVLFLCIFINAQAPQGLNYQAVARTADGVIIPTQNIGVRFSILDVSVTGATLYSETHTVITNSYGLFTLAIGKGTPVTSTFANINWASGTDKFLKVEIAPAGGSNYQLQGTTQLLSVPYALYSEKTRLLAGNNTINITNGNTIAGNYQAGTGINLTGNTISHNLVAGTGISIAGNVITNTGTNQWVADANGIHNQSGNVGIGTNSHSIVPLYVRQPNTGIGNAVAWFESQDVWHSNVRIHNTTSNGSFSFSVGGVNNTEIKPKNFGLYNENVIKWAIVVDANNNNVGFGSPSMVTPLPKSTIHVLTGDVNIEQIGNGIIMKSPNGQCWRVTIDNTGNLVRTSITCPN